MCDVSDPADTDPRRRRRAGRDRDARRDARNGGPDALPGREVGQYVLVDRGMVLEVVDAEEAVAIMAMYEEIGDITDADAAHWVGH